MQFAWHPKTALTEDLLCVCFLMRKEKLYISAILYYLTILQNTFFDIFSTSIMENIMYTQLMIWQFQWSHHFTVKLDQLSNGNNKKYSILYWSRKFLVKLFFLRRPQNLTKSSPSLWRYVVTVKPTVKILSILWSS